VSFRFFARCRLTPPISGLVIYRDRGAYDSGERTDYTPILKAFPRLRAVKHYGQTESEITTGFSKWDFPNPLQVLDVRHSSSMFEEKLLPPDVAPTSVHTLILRDNGYDDVQEEVMIYEEPPSHKLGFITYLARHLKGVRTLILDLALADYARAEIDRDYDDSDDDELSIQVEKTPLRGLLKEDWPDLEEIEFRFLVPYAFGERDICPLVRKSSSPVNTS
jgi:hypothetical protein